MTRKYNADPVGFPRGSVPFCLDAPELRQRRSHWSWRREARRSPKKRKVGLEAALAALARKASA